MSHSITSEKILLKEVFTMWFRVPEYQRPYVWSSDNVNDLLDDVTQALASRPDSEYFLGSIVLQTRTAKDNGREAYEEHDLLDGQQRLTTCLMICAAGRDLSTDDQLRDACNAAIFQRRDPFRGIPERMRVVYDIRDEVREFVNSYIKPKGGTASIDELRELTKAKDASVRNMASALLDIRAYLSAPDAPSLEAFFTFFFNKVLMIYVASSELEDAFRLFTVLNSRGVTLRNSDILKTMNLRALKEEQASDIEQKQAAEMWEELDGELGEEGFDTFLGQLRTILVKEKARVNLLKEFEDRIYSPTEYDKQTKAYNKKDPLLRPGRQTFDLVKRYRRHYQQIFSNGGNYSLCSSWEFDNLVTLLGEAGYADFWVPPVLHYRDIFGDERIVEFLRKLENKFSGDWIARETPTARIESMNAILKEIDAVNATPGVTKSQRIGKLLNFDVFEFDRKEFLKQLDTADIYGRRFARYILLKLDMIYGGPTTRLQPPKDISVEHILPQSPDSRSQWCKDFTPEEREQWTDRLGNLVLLGRRKNSAQGRLDYQDKCQRYFAKNIETFPNSVRVLHNNAGWDLAALKANHNAVLKALESYIA